MARYDEFVNMDFKTLSYGEFRKHNIYGMHIKLTNSALNEKYPHVCIGWSALGDLNMFMGQTELDAHIKRTYPDGPKGFHIQSRVTVLTFRDTMKIGDFVFFGDGSTCHIGAVTSEYKYVEDPDSVYPYQDADYVNNRDVVWYKHVSYRDLSDSFQNCMGATRSLFAPKKYADAVSREIYAILTGRYPDGEDWTPFNAKKYKDRKNETAEAESEAAEIGEAFENTETRRESADEYSVLPDPGNPRNVILYGPPGTGKTYVTSEIAMKIIKKEKIDIDNLPEKKGEERERLMGEYNGMCEKGRVVFTTFHQSYGYEDFIGGLKPDTDSAGELKFKVEDGIFKKIADRARTHVNDNYVIIIDEINRGNVSKIFGELITLIETDKREGMVDGKENVNCIRARLPFAKDGDSPFSVPANLYIVGTMNSADKSISLIDVALRRRFEFMEIKPRAEFIDDKTLRDVFGRINSQLVGKGSGTDLLIGHSYFIGKTADDLPDVMNRCIIPLLYEYFSDSEDDVKDIVNEALGDDYETSERDGSGAFGRITVRKTVRKKDSGE